MSALLRRWHAEVGDTYLLGVVRLAIGALLFWQALGAARNLEDNGYFGDFFHVPMLPETLVPARPVYIWLVAIQLLLAVLVAVGHRARPALFASAGLGLYVLFCDRLQFHHNRYALLCFAFLLAFAPCDRALTITGTTSSRSGPLWAQRLMQVQVSLIYLASGGSKLFDDDWRNGLVIGDRFARYGYQALERGIPPSVVALFSQPGSTSALAKLAIATELFLAVGLWMRRTRVFALWWGVMFHLTIEVTSKVELFTWLTLTTYVLFATPDEHARKFFFDPSRTKSVFYARLVRALDWLSRFDVKPWEPDDLRNGHSIVIVRRDGTRATGIRALAMVARCVPLLFPLWAPIALLATFTKGGEASARA